MNMERAGALALIVAGVAYAALMAVHPSHAGGHPVIGSFSLSGVVHAVALTLKPILVFGYIVFARHLGLDRPVILLGLCFYLMSAMFTMLAGTMSGLVFPYIIEAAHAPGADVDGIREFARYTTWLNRSFAQVHYNIAAIGILLWSIGWAAKSVIDWIGRAVGVVGSLFVLGWQLSGTINFEAQQGALWVTLAQVAFALAAALALLTAKRS